MTNTIKNTNFDRQKLIYRMQLVKGIENVSNGLKDDEERNRFFSRYKLQASDTRFAYQLYGGCLVDGGKLTFAEYKILSHEYNFPEMIQEIFQEIYATSVAKALENVVTALKAYEEL